MKRIALIMLALQMAVFLLSGCAGSAVPATDKKMSIVCTIFPQYDWTRQILGDKADDVELTLLLKNKSDMHSYQPTFGDIAKISDCDLFIYVGGESDLWVEDALKEATNKNMTAINLLAELGEASKEEEIKEGMESEGDEEEGTYDEHVWLSLRNAQIFCSVIAGALSSADPGNAGYYENNLAAYLAKLESLDLEYRAAADAAQNKTLLFCDRFPFRYLTDDYGLDYFAAFAGCTADTDASIGTIIFLIEKVNELDLKKILVTESSDKGLAKTVIRESKEKEAQILVLDAMQSVTSDDAENGAAYLSITESNLNVLKEAMK